MPACPRRRLNARAIRALAKVRVCACREKRAGGGGGEEAGSTWLIVGMSVSKKIDVKPLPLDLKSAVIRSAASLST